MAVAGLALISSRAGVSATACTASTCCNVAIPLLPLSTTYIYSNVCSEGTLPGDDLGKLVNLKTVSLTSQKLSGTLPGNDLGNLVNLHTFQVAANTRLSGTIPESFGKLAGLLHLELSYTMISGVLPAALGQLAKLTLLALSETRVSGIIPEWTGKLAGLKVLDLSATGISGVVPASLISLPELYIFLLNSGTQPEVSFNYKKVLKC